MEEIYSAFVHWKTLCNRNRYRLFLTLDEAVAYVQRRTADSTAFALENIIVTTSEDVYICRTLDDRKINELLNR